MATNLSKWGKQAPQTIRDSEEKEDALEAYFLKHVPGLKGYQAARDEAFRQIEVEAHRRHPDPTPEVIANAEAKEAAFPSRKRMEVQLRRSFAPLALHLPSEMKRSRRRFIQNGQRAWNRANPDPLTSELRRIHTAEFVKACAGVNRL